MNIKLQCPIRSLVALIISSIFSGFIGWWIGIYMSRPDISYYAHINQPAKISIDNSHKVLKSWHKGRRNLRMANTYSSSVYISNTGYHAYKGDDFSHTKEPLRIETDSPMELFAIDDKKSPETAISIKGDQGIYYIEFDFLNYGKSIHFVFTHQKPLKYLHVKGSGIDLPYIKEKTPLRIWIYHNFFLMIFILFIIGILLDRGIVWLIDYRTSKFDKDYYQLLQLLAVEKNKKTKHEIINKIGTLLKKHVEENAKK